MALETGVHRVMVPPGKTDFPGEWRWSVKYYKFRGSGPQPTEHYLGADGILELNLRMGMRQDSKSLLFQAKQEGEGGRSLFEQVIRLTTWREAAFVLIYSSSDYRSMRLDDVIASKGRVKSGAGEQLAEYLGQDFLNCDVGDDELRYDGRRKQLVWRAMNGEVVATKFNVKHRVSFRIEAPRSGKALSSIDRLVDRTDIHQFRMQADEAEVLAMRESITAAAVKRSRKRLALIFHPDRLNELDLFHQNIGKREMQEINAAADRLRRKS